MSRRASVFLGSLGTSLLVASTAFGQTAGGTATVGGDVSADVDAPDLDPGHRFLFDLHVGALAELGADEETESYGGALAGGNIFYGPIDWFSLGVGYERMFFGRDDEVFGAGESRRTSRSGNVLWLTGRFYPYEDENIALFVDLAGAPVWQEVSVSETAALGDFGPVGPGRGCSATDSAKLGLRGGVGLEFPLRSVLIMHAQVGIDHYRFGEGDIDGCGTQGNPTTYFAGRIGFAVATGRIKPIDTDGDGILDVDDACDDERGPANIEPALHGCPVPDRDRDAIPDAADACPDVPGVASTDPAKNGCPLPGDADGDGIVDPVDACRDVPGVASADPAKNGCPPDRDADGVLDTVDACPDVPGVANADPAKNGCPLPTDTDGDGIDDPQDACPKDPGKADPDPKKNGCPLVVVTDKEIVINEQVQFETNQAIIRPVSNALLDNVAQVIKATPMIKKLEVQGHTDSTGAKAHNQLLSQRRAEAVKKALEQRGIEPAKLVAKGYGQDKPIGDNTTDAGKTQNRRVQFLILEKAPAAPAAGSTTAPPGGATPAAGGTTPPAGGTTPPAGGTTPPAGGTTPPAGGTTPAKP